MCIFFLHFTSKLFIVYSVKYLLLSVMDIVFNISGVLDIL